jgi:hypothetical protein
MAEKSWLKKIAALKRLLREVGPLWPDSTKLSGFDSRGPYHCANCEYFKGGETGICIQEVVIADPQVKKNEVGLPIIDDPVHQCCEFVEPPKEKENGKETS